MGLVGSVGLRGQQRCRGLVGGVGALGGHQACRGAFGGWLGV